MAGVISGIHRAAWKQSDEEYMVSAYLPPSEISCQKSSHRFDCGVQLAIVLPAVALRFTNPFSSARTLRQDHIEHQ